MMRYLLSLLLGLILTIPAHADLDWSVTRPVTTGKVDRLPRIAVDPSGRLHGLFHREEAFQSSVLHATYTSGSWTAPETISSPTENAFEGALTFDASGALHAVWASGTSGSAGTGRIVYSVRSSGGWTSPEPVSPPGGQNLHPSVAIDDQGQPVVAWIYSNNLVYAAVRGATGWGTPATFGTTNEFGRTHLHRGPDGRIHFVWIDLRDGSPQVYLASRSGGVWSAPARVSSAPMGTLLQAARVASATDGTLHVAWSSVSGQLFYSQGASGVFSAQATLGNGINPAVAMMAEGLPVIVYDSLDGKQYALQGQAGGGFSALLLISRGLDREGTSPDVVIGNDGRIHVVWEYDARPSSQIRHGIGTPRSAPVPDGFVFFDDDFEAHTPGNLLTADARWMQIPARAVAGTIVDTAIAGNTTRKVLFNGDAYRVGARALLTSTLPVAVTQTYTIRFDLLTSGALAAGENDYFETAFHTNEGASGFIDSLRVIDSNPDAKTVREHFEFYGADGSGSLVSNVDPFQDPRPDDVWVHYDIVIRTHATTHQGTARVYSNNQLFASRGFGNLPSGNIGDVVDFIYLFSTNEGATTTDKLKVYVDNLRVIAGDPFPPVSETPTPTATVTAGPSPTSTPTGTQGPTPSPTLTPTFGPSPTPTWNPDINLDGRVDHGDLLYLQEWWLEDFPGTQ